MADAYLSLGSNLGDRRRMLEEAIQRLGTVPGSRVTARSGFYRTPPWGEIDQGEFLNAVVRLGTELGPRALLSACLEVERALGRVRARKWGPRTIDIDILTYDDTVIADPDLTVPHRHLFERAFVLVPLAEIAPQLVIGGRSIAEALVMVDRTGIERMDESVRQTRPASS